MYKNMKYRGYLITAINGLREMFAGNLKAQRCRVRVVFHARNEFLFGFLNHVHEAMKFHKQPSCLIIENVNIQARCNWKL